MITRTTIWTDEAGGGVQLSYAVLDEVWELLYEATYPLGPFHPLDEELLRAQDDFRRWMRCNGIPLELDLS